MTLHKKVSSEIPAQPLPVTHRLPSSWLLIPMAKVVYIIIFSVCTFFFFPSEASLNTQWPVHSGVQRSAVPKQLPL